MKKHRSPAGSPGSGNFHGGFNSKRMKVQSWLLTDGYQLGEGTADNASWVIGAVNPMGQTILVVQPEQSVDSLVIQANVTLDADFQKKLAELSDAERKSALAELKLALLSIGVDFSGIVEPLGTIGIMTRIFDDGLKKESFHQHLQRVRHGIFAVSLVLGKWFDTSHDVWSDKIN